MNRLNKAQKDKVAQFKTITGASERVAQSCLQTAGWMMEGAIDNFYSSPEPAPPPVNFSRRRSIELIFDRLKDPSQDAILVDGITQFCSELEVEPVDIVVLIISWHFNAATMGEYSRTEFVDGMDELGCDSIPKLKARVKQLRREIYDTQKLKDIWNYAFLFSREKGQKCVQLDTALGMWQLLFSHMHWPLADAWCNYVQNHHKRAVSHDTWTQLLVFVQTISPNMSNFDADTSAWPYLIDEFVEHIRKEQQAKSLS